MTESSRPSGTPGYGTPGGPPVNSSWVSGGVTFAGILLLINGALAVLQGIAAIAEDDIYARFGDYIYKINLTGWGWILLIMGVLALVAGWGVLSGAGWGRLIGIGLASLSMVLQFLFLPYQPLWSIIMIGINIFVIWALAVYQPEETVG
ncbi:hypothetical protein [Streptomyces sp. NPDC086023]|uniref:DUF7144 family membrane protein n=1 Tax=Streptomyces sp. NPDC086023 TaxID=3365746 RepID=UPI0037D7407A